MPPTKRSASTASLSNFSSKTKAARTSSFNSTKQSQSRLTSGGTGGVRKPGRGDSAKSAKGKKGGDSFLLSRKKSKPVETESDEEDVDRVKSPEEERLDAYYRKEVTEKNGMAKPMIIHSSGKFTIDHILSLFDLDYTYGPCTGLSRLDRWERASELGLNPPHEVKQILISSDDFSTKQPVGKGKVMSIGENVFHDSGIL